MCQTGCELESYNSSNKKAICNCNIKQETVADLNVDNLFDKKEISSNFYETLSNSNFQVLKCYKLLFSSLISKNIGEIFMVIILFNDIILNIVSFIIGPRKIHYFIDLIIRNKKINNNLESAEQSQRFGNNKNDRKRKKAKSKNINNNISNPTKKKGKKKAKANEEYIIEKNEDNINSLSNMKMKKRKRIKKIGKIKVIKKNVNKLNKNIITKKKNKMI